MAKDDDEEGGGGSQSVSQTARSCSERGSSGAVRGLRSEVGTDLCDTHAARHITHSLAHNIPSPPPLRCPTFLFEMEDRRTTTAESPLYPGEFITYQDYVVQRFSSGDERLGYFGFSERRGKFGKDENPADENNIAHLLFPRVVRNKCELSATRFLSRWDVSFGFHASMMSRGDFGSKVYAREFQGEGFFRI